MPPIELAERLALLLALALFLGPAFEEVYRRDEPTIPGGIRTFPLPYRRRTVCWRTDGPCFARFRGGSGLHPLTSWASLAEEGAQQPPGTALVDAALDFRPMGGGRLVEEPGAVLDRAAFRIIGAKIEP